MLFQSKQPGQTPLASCPRKFHVVDHAQTTTEKLENSPALPYLFVLLTMPQ